MSNSVLIFAGGVQRGRSAAPLRSALVIHREIPFLRLFTSRGDLLLNVKREIRKLAGVFTESDSKTDTRHNLTPLSLNAQNTGWPKSQFDNTLLLSVFRFSNCYFKLLDNINIELCKI